MSNEVSDVVRLTRWLHDLEYNDIRRGETILTVPVTVGKTRRVLRGVQLAPDLVLGRDRKFYKLMGDHAHKIPLYLVCEQYDLDALIKGYRESCKGQPRSKPA